MATRALFVSCFLAACSSDGKTSIDAPIATVDAPVAVVDGATPDSPAANKCTGLLYDSCTANTGCMSNNCKLFSSAGIQVCTQACSASNPCPAQNGAAIPCNNMGVCRPNAANSCTL